MGAEDKYDDWKYDDDDADKEDIETDVAGGFTNTEGKRLGYLSGVDSLSLLSIETLVTSLFGMPTSH